MAKKDTKHENTWGDDPEDPPKASTRTLVAPSDMQKTYLRGLAAAGQWLPMSASELGDQGAYDLQAMGAEEEGAPGGLVEIKQGKWKITQKGYDFLNPPPEAPPPEEDAA